MTTVLKYSNKDCDTLLQCDLTSVQVLYDPPQRRIRHKCMVSICMLPGYSHIYEYMNNICIYNILLLYIHKHIYKIYNAADLMLSSYTIINTIKSGLLLWKLRTYFMYILASVERSFKFSLNDTRLFLTHSVL